MRLDQVGLITFLLLLYTWLALSFLTSKAIELAHLSVAGVNPYEFQFSLVVH